MVDNNPDCRDLTSAIEREYCEHDIIKKECATCIHDADMQVLIDIRDLLQTITTQLDSQDDRLSKIESNTW